jgi:hypothetical protein
VPAFANWSKIPKVRVLINNNGYTLSARTWAYIERRGAEFIATRMTLCNLILQACAHVQQQHLLNFFDRYEPPSSLRKRIKKAEAGARVCTSELALYTRDGRLDVLPSRLGPPHGRLSPRKLCALRGWWRNALGQSDSACAGKGKLSSIR